MPLNEGRYSRRQFLKRAAVVSVTTAGVVVLAGCQPASSAPAASGGGLETTRLRLVQTPSMCQAAQYVAEDLLREAGFTDLVYVKKPNPTAIGPTLASGEADINLHFAGPLRCWPPTRPSRCQPGHQLGQSRRF